VFADLSNIDSPPGLVAFEAVTLVCDRLALAQKFLVCDETLRPHLDQFLKLAVQSLCPDSPVCRPIREFGLVFLYLIGQKVAYPFQDVRVRLHRVEESFELFVDGASGLALAALRAGCRLAWHM
jgi:hypothetical protein